MVAGTASIYSAWFQKKPSPLVSTLHESTQPNSNDTPLSTGVNSSHGAGQSPTADQPTIDVALSLIPTIQRMKDASGGLMKGGQNDVIGVLRIRQHNGKSARHVRSLQIAGNVAADWNSYAAVFSKGDGTESVDNIEAEYEKRKPFFRLSWVSYPLTPIRIDEHEDEEFGKFAVSRSAGAIEFAGDPKDYFGFWSTNEQPRYPLTTPVWRLLMHFTKTTADLTGIYPELREEVKAGKVKIQVDLDGEIINIPAKQIRFPWAVSLGDQSLEKTSAQDLFYGIDNGSRTSIPTPNDPLVKSK